DSPTLNKSIVPHDFKFLLVTSSRIRIKKLLRLHVGVQFFLPIFESDGQICRPPRFPEKIEVISDSFVLVELRYRAPQPILSFEPDGGVLNRRRLARWRGPGKFSALVGTLRRLVCGRRFLLTGNVFGQQIKFGFSKLKIVAECNRQRHNALDDSRLLARASEYD